MKFKNIATIAAIILICVIGYNMINDSGTGIEKDLTSCFHRDHSLANNSIIADTDCVCCPQNGGIISAAVTSERYCISEYSQPAY